MQYLSLSQGTQGGFMVSRRCLHWNQLPAADGFSRQRQCALARQSYDYGGCAKGGVSPKKFNDFNTDLILKTTCVAVVGFNKNKG